MLCLSLFTPSDLSNQGFTGAPILIPCSLIEQTLVKLSCLHHFLFFWYFSIYARTQLVGRMDVVTCLICFLFHILYESSTLVSLFFSFFIYAHYSISSSR